MGGSRMRITKQWWTPTTADYQSPHSKIQPLRQQCTLWRSGRERSQFSTHQWRSWRCTRRRWARILSLQGWRNWPKRRSWRRKNWRRPKEEKRFLLRTSEFECWYHGVDGCISEFEWLMRGIYYAYVWWLCVFCVTKSRVGSIVCLLYLGWMSAVQVNYKRKKKRVITEKGLLIWKPMAKSLKLIVFFKNLRERESETRVHNGSFEWNVSVKVWRTLDW